MTGKCVITGKETNNVYNAKYKPLPITKLALLAAKRVRNEKNRGTLWKENWVDVRNVVDNHPREVLEMVKRIKKERKKLKVLGI